uniref:Uncharacterized protein n=1 Tax=Trypanosoma vivax (strain Y486) TaxID=1055687 RepID=G0TVR9_TRYVY|nr:hypothetical protein, unlikely [Trypanosoma vivax Y486]
MKNKREKHRHASNCGLTPYVHYGVAFNLKSDLRDNRHIHLKTCATSPTTLAARHTSRIVVIVAVVFLWRNLTVNGVFFPCRSLRRIPNTTSTVYKRHRTNT